MLTRSAKSRSTSEIGSLGSERFRMDQFLTGNRSLACSVIQQLAGEDRLASRRFRRQATAKDSQLRQLKLALPRGSFIPKDLIWVEHPFKSPVDSPIEKELGAFSHISK